MSGKLYFIPIHYFLQLKEGGDEKGNPFEPNIFDKLQGGFSEEDIIILATPTYPDKRPCGQTLCPTCTPENF